LKIIFQFFNFLFLYLFYKVFSFVFWLFIFRFYFILFYECLWVGCECLVWCVFLFLSILSLSIFLTYFIFYIIYKSIYLLMTYLAMFEWVDLLNFYIYMDACMCSMFDMVMFCEYDVNVGERMIHLCDFILIFFQFFILFHFIWFLHTFFENAIPFFYFFIFLFYFHFSFYDINSLYFSLIFWFFVILCWRFGIPRVLVTLRDKERECVNISWWWWCKHKLKYNELEHNIS
jgi:hypothetical protein